MLFTSVEFLVFLPVTLLLYHLAPRRTRWAVLLAASCCFYMWLIPRYILVLVAIIAIDYVAARLIERSAGARRRWLLGLSIAANVGILVAFKYVDFLSGAVHDLAAMLGVAWTPPVLGLLLPLGLSFHTFQSLSYTIEVYRGRQAAERHAGIYALYVLFFPQLVAGPIERPQQLLPQLHRPREIEYGAGVTALRLILLGVVKKVAIADTLALPVDAVYADLGAHSAPAIVLATWCFAFQIYCDFSGYTDIARGVARLFGVELMVNFDRPYVAQSVGEFWRRWHISLSTWFRDYVYVPLGGGRVPAGRRVRNTLVVFLLSGLWHGAQWTYVAWGAFHGAIVAATRRWWGMRETPRDGRLARTARIVVTFNVVSAGWLLFRARSLGDALSGYRRLLTAWSGTAPGLLAELQLTPGRALMLPALVGALLAFEAAEARPALRHRFGTLPVPARWALYYAAVLVVLALGRGEARQFIYFQF